MLEDASKIDVERSQLRSLFELVNHTAACMCLFVFHFLWNVCLTPLGDAIDRSELHTLLELVTGKELSPDDVTSSIKALQPAKPDTVTFDEFYKVSYCDRRLLLLFCFALTFANSGGTCLD